MILVDRLTEILDALGAKLGVVGDVRVRVVGSAETGGHGDADEKADEAEAHAVRVFGTRRAASSGRADTLRSRSRVHTSACGGHGKRSCSVSPPAALGMLLAKRAGMTCSCLRCEPLGVIPFLASFVLVIELVLAAQVSLWTMPASGVVVETAAPGEAWRQLRSIGGRGGLPSALARTGRDEIAVADEAGVTWWRDGVAERAVLPPVRDLEFGADGTLWIATLDGLYSWMPTERPTPRRLRGGEAANRVHRIAMSPTAMLIGTGAGAYWSPDGRIFQPLRVGGAATPISLVALRPAELDSGRSGSAPHPHAGQAQAWLYGSGRLFKVRGLEAASGMRVIDVQSVSLPRPVSDGEPVDLVIDPSGDRLYFVYDDSIAWRSLGRPHSDASPRDDRMGWRFERPGLPPGSMIRRLGWASGRIWITTDHGLLAGESWQTPFRRASSPVGTTDCVEMRARPPLEVLALCRAGLFVLAPFEAEPPISSGLPELELPPDPPLAEIRRRAMLRAGLTAGRSHDLWARLRKRAFWPEVGLRFDADFDFTDERDRDQSFVSGDTRRLHDRSRDEGQTYQAGIELDWDLGGVVYPDDSVDLSRELRQVVSLRDDVADEINQLYFERQSIREQLAGSSATPLADAARLRWRARELDAGLDAWTGGWISEWRARSALDADRLGAGGLSPFGISASRLPASFSDPLHPEQRDERIRER